MDMIIVIAIAEGSGFIGYSFIFAIEFYEKSKKASAEKRMRRSKHRKI